MNKKVLLYNNHKLYLKINKSSSDFGSSAYMNFINENNKNEISKINSLFTLNQEYNKDMINNIHKSMLHSKIKLNPIYNKLEIECYSCKKMKKKESKEFFLTTNFHKPFKKSRNTNDFFKSNENKNTFNSTNYNKRKYKTIYPIASTRIDMNKYYFDSNKNIKEFVSERRLINKLKYINKLKNELKEKRENEIEEDYKLYDINCISLLKSQNLLKIFETDRNYYNRYLLNELMNNKQILLKIKLKQSILEGQVINLKKKCDELKNRSNILREFKNFLLCVKNQVSTINNYMNKTIDAKTNRRTSVCNKNKIEQNNIPHRTPLKKRYSVYIPKIKKNNYGIKQKMENNKKRSLVKKITFDISKSKEKEFSLLKHKNSDTELFETSLELDNKINKIEESLITLLFKNNKKTSEIIKMKINKQNEFDSLKVDSNVKSKIKLYEELIHNYQDYNNDLNNKLNSLIIEKDNQSFNILVHKKIKQILITINKNSKYFEQYENIFDRLKKALNKSRMKNKNIFIFEGIIIIENFLYRIQNDIDNYAKNTEEDFIEKIRYKIEKEKKYSNDKKVKDELMRKLKLKKIFEKMNKICLTSRKVPEKFNYFKKNKNMSKNK